MTLCTAHIRQVNDTEELVFANAKCQRLKKIKELFFANARNEERNITKKGVEMI